MKDCENFKYADMKNQRTCLNKGVSKLNYIILSKECKTVLAMINQAIVTFREIYIYFKRYTLLQCCFRKNTVA